MLIFLLSNIQVAYRKSEQCLGSHHDERLAEVTDHLSPQQVEVLGWGGGVDQGHVHVVTVHALLFTVTHLMHTKKGRVSNRSQFRLIGNVMNTLLAEHPDIQQH